MPTWNQEADFEEGNLNDWDATVDTGTQLSASTSAKKNGSYGMAVGLSTTAAYGTFTGPTAENDITLEFWLDPNGCTVATAVNNEFIIVRADLAITCFQLRLRNTTGIPHQLRFYVFDDANAVAGGSGTPITITDDFHKIRIVWRAATGVGANDGFGMMWIDDVLVASYTGIDSDLKSIASLDFGSVSQQDAGISGTIYFDDVRWYAGMEAVGSLSGAVSSIVGALVESVTMSLSGAVSSIVGLLTYLYDRPQIYYGEMPDTTFVGDWPENTYYGELPDSTSVGDV